jgi:putative addiction module component (TIGR02574 family)
MNPGLSQLSGLSVSEKLQLVQDLWDQIAATPEDVPIPEWQQEELARRKADHLANPGSGIPWSEARDRIRKGHD